MYKNMYIAH